MKLKSYYKQIFILSATIAALLVFAIFQTRFSRNLPNEKTLFTSLGQPKSLDPAFASDYASCVFVLSLYDTLFQYDYLARPYRVIPSMLTQMPTVSNDGLTWDFELRNDLSFIPDSCFSSDTECKVTSDDVIYSLLRLADARVSSPGYWLLRGKIKGLDQFRNKTIGTHQNDFSMYKDGCQGLQKISSRSFRINLVAPDPRLPYYLAMAYTAILPQSAIQTYGTRLADHPVGSGPFILSDYQRDYRLEMTRNPKYRIQFFPGAATVIEQQQPLPYLDKIICYLVQDPQPGWLMFLNGELDLSTVNKDQMDMIGAGGSLPSPLSKRGIKLLTAPELQINYIGFSFTDPLLGRNLHLRRAISLAYNVGLRQTYFNGLIIPASGPIPPAVAGHDSVYQNPWSAYNLEKAKSELILAGYPGGVDSVTGKPLTLTFDLPENSTAARQLAEMMVRDMEKIGITIEPLLNSKPKFLEKNRAGQMQLFRFNWVGDYPDAENFLQLFYGPNAGSSNRIFYHNQSFNQQYTQTIQMPDSPERTKRYRQLARDLCEDCPWIFESYPLSFRLIHEWVDNYYEHDFGFDRWKYISVDPVKRNQMKKEFTPLSINALR